MEGVCVYLTRPAAELFTVFHHYCVQARAHLAECMYIRWGLETVAVNQLFWAHAVLKLCIVHWCSKVKLHY